MIGEGKFQTQLTTCEVILSTCRLLEERNRMPVKTLGAAHFKRMTYRQVYEECLAKYAYDFRLTDQSLMLFVKGGQDPHDGLLGFSYYECPIRIITYEEFVGDQLAGITPLDPSFDEVVAEAGDELRQEYETYINSADAKTIVTPMRYDYKASDYKEGCHPASHVHIGFGNEIRIGTRRIMNPISFTLFIVRQRYPDCWTKLMDLADSEVWCRNVRDSLDEIHTDYWHEKDKREICLH